MEEARVSECLHGIEPYCTQLTYIGPMHKQEINLYFLKPVDLGVICYIKLFGRASRIYNACSLFNSSSNMS